MWLWTDIQLSARQSKMVSKFGNSKRVEVNIWNDEM